MRRWKSRAAWQVEEFHETFGLPVRREKAEVGTVEERELRVRLIAEEATEFVEACDREDLIEMADALADLLYVTYGAAIQFGIPLDSVVEEVHRSNMTKLWTDEDLATLPGPGDGSAEEEFGAVKAEQYGRWIVYRMADGKVIKPPSYSPADVLGVLVGSVYASDADGTGPEGQ